VAQLIEGLNAGVVRANVERVRAEIRSTGRDPEEVEILAAVKYLPPEGLGALKEAGIELLGENRAQELKRKVEAHPGDFTWDFLVALQIPKVHAVPPYGCYL